MSDAISPDLVRTDVRHWRSVAGLTQRELATKVGLSRQALIAIERGQSTPSTAVALKLAAVLRCTVEQLFALQTRRDVVAVMGQQLAPGARVTLGDVQGRLVAHPQADSSRAADGVAGPIDTSHSSAVIHLVRDDRPRIKRIFVAGCAPLLGLLAERFNRRSQTVRAVWVPAHSAKSLRMLQQGLVHIAGVHLAPSGQPAAHVRAATTSLRGASATLVHLAQWRQGLLVAPGNPFSLRAGTDLLQPAIRLVGRSPGAGAQILLERALAEALDEGQPASPPGLIARNHDEVANMVRWGAADVGVAIEASAIAHGLDFVPLAEERFDLIVPQANFATDGVRELLEQIGASGFRRDAAALPGYDVTHSGEALTVAASGGV